MPALACAEGLACVLDQVIHSLREHVWEHGDPRQTGFDPFDDLGAAWQRVAEERGDLLPPL